MSRNLTTQYYSERFIRFVVIFDELVLLVGIMAFLGYIHWHFTPWHVSRGYLRIMVIACLAYIICCMQTGVVLHHRFVRSDHILRRVIYTQFYFVFLTLIIFWSLHGIIFFSSYLLPLYTMMFLAALAHRWLLRKILEFARRRGPNIRRVAFIGNPFNAQRLCASMLDFKEGYHFLGYFNDQPVEHIPDSVRYLGTIADVVPYLEQHPKRINEIYDATPTTRDDELQPIVDFCDNHLIHFYSIPLIHSYLHRRTSVENVSGSIILSLRYEPLSRTENRFLKRTFDLFFSVAFLLTLFPIIYVVVAFVTKFTSPGPVFFRQLRTGMDGRPFWLYKFRSMHVNAESDTLQATPDDPRTTRFGRFLRRSNIDELPQFINVFFGNMSVIGPRPHMLKHTDDYSEVIDKYMVRHFIKPGITGWAQIKGFRGATPRLWQMEGRVERDIWYLEHWTLSLDIYIIIRTLINWVRGDRNAY